MTGNSNSKWYDNKAVVILLLILFFPVGLYALWKNQAIAKGWKIGVTIFFALAILASIGSNDKKKRHKLTDGSASVESSDLPTETITAHALTSEYEENEVKADAKFKNQKIRVSGRVKEIKKDILDNIYVLLDGGSSGGFRNVQCFLDDPNIAVNLSKGDNVSFVGKCDGLMGNVLIKDCNIE